MLHLLEECLEDEHKTEGALELIIHHKGNQTVDNIQCSVVLYSGLSRYYKGNVFYIKNIWSDKHSKHFYIRIYVLLIHQNICRIPKDYDRMGAKTNFRQISSDY